MGTLCCVDAALASNGGDLDGGRGAVLMWPRNRVLPAAWENPLRGAVGASRRPNDVPRAADADGDGLLSRLHSQELEAAGSRWNWRSTVGQRASCAVVSCVELAALADFPSKLQVWRLDWLRWRLQLPSGPAHGWS